MDGIARTLPGGYAVVTRGGGMKASAETGEVTDTCTLVAIDANAAIVCPTACRRSWCSPTNNVRNLTYAQLDYCSTVWHVIDSRVDRELQWAKESHHAPQMYPPGINGSCHVFSRRGGSSTIV